MASIEKAWFYERLFPEVEIVMVKDKKYRYNVNKNQFYALHEVGKSNINSSVGFKLQEI